MEFSSEEQAAEGTKRHKQRMGDRWIEIYPSTHEEMRARKESTAAMVTQYVINQNVSVLWLTVFNILQNEVCM